MANQKDYEDEEMTVELELEDGSIVNCAVITILAVEGKDYIVLLPLDENGENEDGEVWFYGYSENPDDPNEEPELSFIEDDEEYERCREVGETVDGQLRRRIVGLDKQTHQYVREEHKQRRDKQSADHRCQQCDAFRGRHPFLISQSEVVTDDGLRRLCDGIAYHKDERHVVTCDAECAYTVVAQVLREYLIADEHQHGHCGFCQQRG